MLRWLIKAMPDYRTTRLTTDVALIVLDLYADQLGKSPEVDMLVDHLSQRVKVCVEASQTAISVLGMCDLLVAGSMGEPALE